jgi:geranylgeranyl transferase type-2 subunit beta
LKVLTAVDTELTADTIRFLAGMQADEGGFRANTRIPVADLLSTFTGLLTLTDLNGLSRINTSAIQRYLGQLELDEGGFYGAAWDREVDVEYTFYGLATAALLAQL